MKSSKKRLATFAKTIFKKSLTQNLVDEKKVRTILKELSLQKPAGLPSILKTYKRLIAHKLAQEEITVETADKTTLEKSFIENLKRKAGAQKVVRKTSPNIVFGARISYGDWILDDTLAGKLKQITINK